MQNRIWIVSAAVTFAVAAIAGTIPAEKNQPQFKNLKVLPKDISEEKLDSIMHNFNYSLGVRCGYCHARSEDGKHLDFASDAKSEKDIARHMFTMTADLNKKYFNFKHERVVPQTIACITCHRQQPIPQTDSLLALMPAEHH